MALVLLVCLLRAVPLVRLVEIVVPVGKAVYVDGLVEDHRRRALTRLGSVTGTITDPSSPLDSTPDHQMS